MVAEANKAIIRRYFEEGWNKGNSDAAAEVFSEDYVNHNPGIPGMPAGRKGVKVLIGAFRSVFPDLTYTIEDQIADGDSVVTRWTLTGTQMGEFQGLPPTGKRVSVSGIQIDRIQHGKIVEHWRETDILGMLQQLGVIPAPGQ